jgi:hypothetical protein
VSPKSALLQRYYYLSGFVDGLEALEDCRYTHAEFSAGEPVITHFDYN